MTLCNVHFIGTDAKGMTCSFLREQLGAERHRQRWFYVSTVEEQHSPDFLHRSTEHDTERTFTRVTVAAAKLYMCDRNNSDGGNQKGNGGKLNNHTH